MLKPMISVVMSAYNSEKYISKTIESILCQTFKDFEFIIIDDCSKDNTYQIIHRYAKKDKRIRIIRNNRNLGIISAVNRGLKIAKADFIARMDSDDIAYPERLEKQLQFLKKRNDIAVVGSSILLLKPDGSKEVRKYATDDSTLRRNIFFFSPIANPTALIRKEVFDNIGNYRLGYEKVEDQEFWLRLGTRYKFANLPEVLLSYRLHPSQQTASHARMSRKTFALRWEYRKNKAYKFTWLALFYNISAVVAAHVLPTRILFAVFERLRKGFLRK